MAWLDPPARCPFQPPTFKPTASSCSSKASVWKTTSLPSPKNTATAASAIISCSTTSKRVVWLLCCLIRPALNPITGAPTKSLAKSCVTASSTRTPQPMSSRKKSAKPTSRSVSVASIALLPITAFKKKLYSLDPKNPPPVLPTQRTGKQIRVERADIQSLEREVRQLLADKVSCNLLGLWLLAPEHLRLGTWDLRR